MIKLRPILLVLGTDRMQPLDRTTASTIGRIVIEVGRGYRQLKNPSYAFYGPCMQNPLNGKSQARLSFP